MEPDRQEALQRLFEHGGDINSAASAFPDAPKPWIDLSTGINPAPYPVGALPTEAWTRLPSPADLARLQSAAAARYGVQPANVVAAPGAQALIQWLPRLFPAARVGILGPTYAGHETAWRAAGAEIVALEAASHIVVVNPNNPDGRRLEASTLHELAHMAARRKGLLIVDESFADFEPGSFAEAEPPATIVLRSFGKAYGLAGLRLGFALAPPDMATRLRVALGAWPVSGAAVAIGARALADDEWLRATQTRLIENGRWLAAELSRAGFDPVGATPLFQLVRRPDAERAFVSLCRAGVLARPFRHEPNWLRFGLPAREHFERLSKALIASSQ